MPSCRSRSIALIAVAALVPALPSRAAEPTQDPKGAEESLSDYYRKRVPAAALVAKGKAPWVLFRTYKSEMTARIDRAYAPRPEFWIDTAWAVMEMKVGMIPTRNHAKVAGAALELWDKRPQGRHYGHKGLQNYVTRKHGVKVGGDIMIARTNPPQRQQMAVRRKLLKMICLMHNFQQVLLETADRYKGAVMPGYTHIRHAQPTTLGHYLLSVHDPIERSMATLEQGCHLMSLNELGCGALAGTSWPVDRELVSAYLGLEGLIENTNDAVSYSDGYVVIAAGAANIMAVLSRMSQDLEYWSTLEYDFVDFAIGAGSFMMPNKRSNQGTLEGPPIGAAKALGALVEAASMGMKVPHADVQPMAYHMDESALAALKQIDTYVEPFLYHLPTMIVHEDKMLAMARRGYSCSTELANVLVRKHGLDYRTAHDVVNHFVVASAQKGIPSREADIALFQVAAEQVVKKKLDFSEQELRQALDPAHFVEVTNCRGGVAPKEVARMIAERKKRLSEARARNLARIEMLEKGKERMLADLRAIHEAAEAP